jgi:hypothetical protein
MSQRAVVFQRRDLMCLGSWVVVHSLEEKLPRDAGFLFDREWMVVKAENGRTIAMGRAPKLALVQPSLPAAALRGEPVPANATLGTELHLFHIVFQSPTSLTGLG